MRRHLIGQRAFAGALHVEVVNAIDQHPQRGFQCIELLLLARDDIAELLVGVFKKGKPGFQVDEAGFAHGVGAVKVSRIVGHALGIGMIPLQDTLRAPMTIAYSYAAQTATTPLAPWSFERRALRPGDVAIDILFCGVCHSDIHQARDEWGGSRFPMVPGHEIVGRVSRVGSAVKNFHVGDAVGVGCIVDSCRLCPECGAGQEHFCEKGMTGTYNSKDRQDGSPTYGGYSSHIVVDENYVLRVSETLPLHAVAPLLCAGITTYSPLKHWNVGPGQKVGVVGLGGLGHMAVKLACAMGAEVVLFTSSPGKVADALRLGAHAVVISSDKAQMKAHSNSFHFILDCVSAPHDLNAYLSLLRRDGTMTLVGIPDEPPQVAMFALVGKRRKLAGSFIGGIAETQEMLDFCAKHGIVSDVELIPIQQINEAYERMIKSDVKYRFVIDLASLKASS